jgi:uncharacterized protein YciI
MSAVGDTSPAGPAGGVPDVDFPLDRYRLVLLLAGPRADELDAATVERLQGEHIAHLLGLQAEGRLLVAGAVVDEPGAGGSVAAGAPVVGLGLFPDGDVDELRATIAGDPGIAEGLYAARVHTFLTPAGGLAFPASGPPAEPAG